MDNRITLNLICGTGRLKTCEKLNFPIRADILVHGLKKFEAVISEIKEIK